MPTNFLSIITWLNSVNTEIVFGAGDIVAVIATTGYHSWAWLKKVPIRPIKDTEGFILGLATENLRDESDRN